MYASLQLSSMQLITIGEEWTYLYCTGLGMAPEERKEES